MWSGRASVRLSHRSTAATVADGFPAERWCLQQLSFDSCSVADAVSILLRADGGRSTVYTDIDIDRYFSYNVYLLANKLMMSCLYLFFSETGLRIHPTVLPPGEQLGARRLSEMQELYGAGAAMIHGMETAMQLSFDRNTDRYKPRPWPALPLNIQFD